jgi:hypothetical protein
MSECNILINDVTSTNVVSMYCHIRNVTMNAKEAAVFFVGSQRILRDTQEIIKAEVKSPWSRSQDC